MSLGDIYTWKRGDYLISTDRSRLQVDVVAAYLANDSYWARGIPYETVVRSLDAAVVFGLHRRDGQGGESREIEETRQVGFARVISDLATFAYLADVFVLEAYRGRGLSKWLMECVMAHPQLQGLRRWMLATRDAHSLYQRHGFTPLAAPEKFMERHDRAVYGPGAAGPGDSAEG